MGAKARWLQETLLLNNIFLSAVSIFFVVSCWDIFFDGTIGCPNSIKTFALVSFFSFWATVFVPERATGIIGMLFFIEK